jgi:hypothetical protein
MGIYWGNPCNRLTLVIAVTDSELAVQSEPRLLLLRLLSFRPAEDTINAEVHSATQSPGHSCQAAAGRNFYAVNICSTPVRVHCFELKEGKNDSLKPGPKPRLL